MNVFFSRILNTNENKKAWNNNITIYYPPRGMFSFGIWIFCVFFLCSSFSLVGKTLVNMWLHSESVVIYLILLAFVYSLNDRKKKRNFIHIVYYFDLIVTIACNSFRIKWSLAWRLWLYDDIDTNKGNNNNRCKNNSVHKNPHYRMAANYLVSQWKRWTFTIFVGAMCTHGELRILASSITSVQRNITNEWNLSKCTKLMKLQSFFFFFILEHTIELE